MSASPIAIEQAADRLLAAATSGEPCAPVRDLIGPLDVDAAYEVQRRVIATRLADGAEVVGRKIGLTSIAVQQQLGVDQPDFGVLLSDMVYADGDEVPSTRLLQPKVEAEIAFGLNADLAEGELDREQVVAAVAWAAASLEIVDSRVSGWDITFADTVADNASSGLYVVSENRVPLAEIDPVAVQMTMSVNGVEVSTGTGAASLGDPITALLWLARTARDFGEPLRAGQVVLSGALGPMVAVNPGDHVVAEISGLGTVASSFSAQNQSAQNENQEGDA